MSPAEVRPRSVQAGGLHACLNKCPLLLVALVQNFISQWLFHFAEPVSALMTKDKMVKLQAQVR